MTICKGATGHHYICNEAEGQMEVPGKGNGKKEGEVQVDISGEERERRCRGKELVG